MFAKLTMLILGLGLLAALLLVNRQRRYEIVGETVRVHAEIQQLQRAIQERKVRVTEATRPSELERMRSATGHEWKSLGDRTVLFERLEEHERDVEDASGANGSAGQDG